MRNGEVEILYGEKWSQSAVISLIVATIKIFLDAVDFYGSIFWFIATWHAAYAVLFFSYIRLYLRFLPRDASAERGDATVSRPSVCPSVRDV